MNRAQTLDLALLLMNVLLGALCLAVARGERRSPALRLWGWGMLLYALGLAITILVFIPGPPRFTAGNVLIALASILSVRGVLANTRRQLDMRWTWTLFVAVACVLVYFNFAYIASPPSRLANTAVPTLMAVILFTTCTIWLLKDPPAEAIIPARFLAATMILAIFIWVLRLVYLWEPLATGRFDDRVDLIVALFAIAQVVLSVACTLTLFWIEVRKMEVALTTVAFSDSLTGLPNRRGAMERFRAEASRAARHGNPFAMLVLDIDHFKRVNDTHGHLAGDAVIKHVAETLGTAKREEDVLSRIGGEEFVLLLTDPASESALHVSDRLRQKVADKALHYGGLSFNTTVSGGLALYPADGIDWDQLFAAADKRLYDSKRGGRNLVTGPAAA
jgi:diguanylate cyclase (GGDEF)-like protein